jgi:chemotaxis protein histidine kinase CheA
MIEPLFDQSFYDQFAQNTAQRLEAIAAALRSYRQGALPYADLVQMTRIALHNMSGEARLLDLFDLGSQISRLSRRMGRMGEPAKVALSAGAADHFLVCCQTLSTFAGAAATQRQRPADPERNAFVQALVALEQAP